MTDDEFTTLRNSPNGFWECKECYIPPCIPEFVSKDDALDKAKWNGLVGKELFNTINSIYEEITSWRRNLFKVPTGKAGQEFISEINNCLKNFSASTPLEPIALKMTLILFPVLLQKPSRKSKAKDHATHLSRRLTLLKAGKISDIVHEGREIQKRLISSKKKTPDNT
ncbi:MAG: hypothetical protein GY816_07830, partial [Cytophagales bacterium]|nr:hypothetical protein [Cytophagales bacterium]